MSEAGKGRRYVHDGGTATRCPCWQPKTICSCSCHHQHLATAETHPAANSSNTPNTNHNTNNIHDYVTDDIPNNHIDNITINKSNNIAYYHIDNITDIVSNNYVDNHSYNYPNNIANYDIDNNTNYK